MKLWVASMVALSVGACIAPPPTGVKGGADLPAGRAPTNAASSDVYDQPPVLISGKAPHYPGSPLLGGYADLTFLVDVDGSTREHEIIETNDEDYAKAAVEAVHAWTFSPAMKD